MSSRFDAYRADGTTTVDVAFWNRIFRDIDTRIVGIEEKKASFEEVERTLINVGLGRVNEVLQPAAERIFRVAELGFLVASSDENVAFVEGQSASILIREGDQRSMFRPSPFIAIVRRVTPNDYVIGRTHTYDPVSGVLQFEVETVVGSGGPFNDWDVAAIAGSVMAQIKALDEARSIGQQVDDDKGATLGYRNAAEGYAGAAGIARDQAVEARNQATGALSSFMEVYRGPQPEAPPDGEIGHFYFDTVLQQARVYTTAGWIPLFTVALGGVRQGHFAATAGQTEFSADEDFTFISVFQNGALLTPGEDYSVASPDFTLTAGASGGDVIAYLAYHVSDDSDFYTKAVANSLFGMDGGTY